VSTPSVYVETPSGSNDEWRHPHDPDARIEAAEQLEAAAEVTKRAVAVIEEMRASIMDRTTCTRLVGCGALTCAAMQTC